MTSTFLGTAVADILDAVLADDPDYLYVVNPSPHVFERLTEAAVAVEADLPAIRILGEVEMLKGSVADFLVASTVADLVAAEVLSVRTLSSSAFGSTILSEDRAVSLIEAGDVVGGLSTTDAEFVATTVEATEAAWENAGSFSVRTPAISRVLETLEEAIGVEVREDFQATLDTLETVRGEDGDLDEVTISLLVAAKNGVLLYDISKWGEDVGIASKATFSRTKTRLEDVGLIDTEKVPIDVGRPRLRLRLAGGLDAADDPATIVETAVDHLSENP
ncbi:Uncharacterized protein HSRCO_2165 [Halanaeroarchaeum sp. HSR-CO]|uniref:transcriptional regulator TbsP n=1 Tax=Halanaeroarchaeum sp. HSR-CO TaxID=2866382 RepID=UPI00217D8296|nr:DUF5821 family protein [Halanaeroarchaeum sp. HSR-CO]UWG48435.1 Uncharacterized protein HSRCO_2165 [Halanaeroarchaeum sp. HSR-CO]